jgi:2-C-methyl-D-erythritol 4-phosphate cytidylyltransferase
MSITFYDRGYDCENEWRKVKRILGGEERYHSSQQQLRLMLIFKESNLIFHDAARPLVTYY